ncbi:TetR/AcrR family transcriptional regulator [Streptosporangium sp. 'caverna']|uniref:TetR/AcrR family transcriptional regulator n=1 Tax=Streptosporangium sp. 'caverna' TaxID=2202249 RepID=UPI000D7D2EE7|nr:TetR/AcrR family transcriptional regulator [Streptosporangium sp. 'caverna']AWS46590.1 TetR/AcrR family transcriptional regulator [Streptosporangium sp. 'caverna']
MARSGDERAAPGRARRADAARNAELLLSAAKELFDEYGPEVALDDVARRAGLGNATLYRHFPTRGDLFVAVYADEVDALCLRGAALLHEPSAAEALFDWLDGFIVHVATKRALALAATESPDGRRTELFDRWHESMRSTAESLLIRARDAGAVRSDLSVGDLLALTSAAAMVSADTHHARRLLQFLRRGFEAAETDPPTPFSA